MTGYSAAVILSSLRTAGRAIVRLRWSRGWSQEELALVADVSPKTIAKMERDSPCRPGTAKRVADALGVKVEDIVILDENAGGVSGAVGQAI